MQIKRGHLGSGGRLWLWEGFLLILFFSLLLPLLLLLSVRFIDLSHLEFHLFLELIDIRSRPFMAPNVFGRCDGTYDRFNLCHC